MAAEDTNHPPTASMAAMQKDAGRTKTLLGIFHSLLEISLPSPDDGPDESQNHILLVRAGD